MQKSIKKIYLAVLSAIVLICAVFLCLPPDRLARADVEITTSTSDFMGWSAGVTLSEDLFDNDPGAEDFELSQASYVMNWTFELRDHTRQNLSEFCRGKTRNWWGSLGQNIFIYEFTLYAHNGDGDGGTFTARPQGSLLIVLTANVDAEIYGYVAEKKYYSTGCFYDYRQDFGYQGNPNLSVSGPIFGIKTTTDFTKEDIATNGRTFQDSEGRSYKFGGGYNVLFTLKLRSDKQNLNFTVDGNGYPSFNFETYVQSAFSEYFMECRYFEQWLSYSGMFMDTYDSRAGRSTSAIRSVADEIERIDNSVSGLEEYFSEDSVDYAEDVLETANTTEVTVKYLEEIPGTPFANAVYDTVSIPVLHGEISINDVESALGKDLHVCLGSHAKYFELEQDPEYGPTFVLKYLKHTWLKAITVDGAALSFFLDINDSFKGTYTPYMDEDIGILDQEPYEYVFSVLKTRYPELRDYTFHNLYGYFGIILIPESFSINTALKEIFDVTTSEIGVVGTFETPVTLNTAQYNALMEDYNYGFLAKIWGSYISILGPGDSSNARLYLIYSEPGTEKAVIGENGAEDLNDSGSVLNKEIIEPYTDILKNVWTGIAGFFGGIAGNFESILIGAVIIAAAGVVIYILIKRRK